jgi:hypothetical protein
MDVPDPTPPFPLPARGPRRAWRKGARAILVAAGLVLGGCGLLHNSEPLVPVHPDTAELVEGEVRDEVTLAPIADAEVVLETDIPGHVVIRRSDTAGRFSLGFASRVYPRRTPAASVVGRVFLAPEYEDASKVTIRAHAPGRCSPARKLERPYSTRRLVLLVGDCAMYGERGATTQGAPGTGSSESGAPAQSATRAP